jgi:RTX calcium-binding nonapeptide repeat (4 copies)
MMIRRLLVLTALLCAFGAAPAEASTGCGRFDDGELRVGIISGADAVGIVRSGEGIVVTVNGAPITCQGTAPTVRNTDTIALSDISTAPNQVTIDLSGGAFAPGATAELGSNDEIEFDVFLSGPDVETLQLHGGPAADSLRLGQSAGSGGVNLNAGSESGPAIGTDVDLTFGGVDFVVVDGGPGDDSVDAGGGAEFAGAVARTVLLTGAAGNDRLRGGDASDRITDGPGDDVVAGGDGGDTFDQTGDTGDDTSRGERASTRSAMASWQRHRPGWTCGSRARKTRAATVATRFRGSRISQQARVRTSSSATTRATSSAPAAATTS